MLKTCAAIVVFSLGMLATASALPGDQVSFHGNDLAVHAMTLQHQYVDNNGEAYSMNRIDISAAAASPIELKSYHGMYMVPSREYVSQLKTARTPRTMFQVFDQPEWDWRPHIGHLPNVRSRETVLALAQMANNAYSSDEKSRDWRDIDGHWQNGSYGYNDNGVRAQVFGNQHQSLFVIAIKGTSAGVWPGPTNSNDKLNDNLLYSCCCAHSNPAWQRVCDCFTGQRNECNKDCLRDSLLDKSLYYRAAMDIYFELYENYPDATIWFTGHSLGGGVASLLGLTFGNPAVTFQAPGDRMAAQRLHLPPKGRPEWRYPIWQFGNTADPIFEGVCTGPSSVCWLGGFAIETRCHIGRTCVWDTVGLNGWRVDIQAHRIGVVIDRILTQTESEYPMPDCLFETECSDCSLWKFVDTVVNHTRVNQLE
ncbi:Putative lipase atg15 [Umbelopsis nana]